MVEVKRCPETPIKVSSMAAQVGVVLFSIPFRMKIISTPRYAKVKMPIVNFYDDTTGPEEYLGV